MDVYDESSMCTHKRQVPQEANVEPSYRILEKKNISLLFFIEASSLKILTVSIMFASKANFTVVNSRFVSFPAD
jgi:hypothetical protein